MRGRRRVRGPVPCLRGDRRRGHGGDPLERVRPVPGELLLRLLGDRHRERRNERTAALGEGHVLPVHRHLNATMGPSPAPVFLGVEAALIWCVFRYRKRDDQPAPQSVGGGRSLGVFFAIPAVIIAVLFPFGEATLLNVERRETPQVQIKVEGFQWEWTFLYLNEGIFVAGKTLVRPAVMVLPVDEPVQIQLVSRDVIHSFFVPDLLFKRDAIPGRTTTFTFTPTQLGTFHAQCAEFCG